MKKIIQWILSKMFPVPKSNRDFDMIVNGKPKWSNDNRM